MRHPCNSSCNHPARKALTGQCFRVEGGGRPEGDSGVGLLRRLSFESGLTWYGERSVYLRVTALEPITRSFVFRKLMADYISLFKTRITPAAVV